MTQWALEAIRTYGDDVKPSVELLVECMPSAVKLLEARFGIVRMWKRAEAWDAMPFCNILMCGFPCNGPSTANGLRGDALDNAHTRHITRLFHSLSSTEERDRPRMMLLENVEGLLHARHDGVRGGFLRWVITNLQNLGYHGAYQLFTSGNNVMSGNRVFLFCHRPDVVAGGSFLKLGTHTPQPEVNEGFGFNLSKPRDHPMVGRLPCPTVGAGTCFLYRDGRSYRCWRLSMEALAGLFTLKKEDITADGVSEKEQQEMLANACRPVGRAIVHEMVRLAVDGVPAPYPDGAKIWSDDIDEGESMPTSGRWNLSEVHVYPTRQPRARIIPTPECDAENTAIAWARSIPDCNKEFLGPDQIDSYIGNFIEKQAAGRTYKHAGKFLASLFMAAHPQGSILTNRRDVPFESGAGEGSVRLDHLGGGGLPHRLKMIFHDGREVTGRVFLGLRKKSRGGWVGYAWSNDERLRPFPSLGLRVEMKQVENNADVDSIFDQERRAQEEEDEDEGDGGEDVDEEDGLGQTLPDVSDDGVSSVTSDAEESDAAISETDTQEVRNQRAENRVSARPAALNESPELNRYPGARRSRRLRGERWNPNIEDFDSATEAPFGDVQDTGVEPTQSSGVKYGWETEIYNGKALAWNLDEEYKRRKVFQQMSNGCDGEWPQPGKWMVEWFDKVWKHVEEFNVRGVLVEPDLREVKKRGTGPHGLHESKKNKKHWRHEIRKRPYPRCKTCGRCAGLQALRHLRNDDVTKAFEIISDCLATPNTTQQ